MVCAFAGIRLAFLSTIMYLLNWMSLPFTRSMAFSFLTAVVVILIVIEQRVVHSHMGK